MKPIFLWAEDLALRGKGDRFSLSSSESHHFKRVLRGNSGEELMLLDGDGHIARAICTNIHTQYIEVEVIEKEETKKRPQLHIYGPAPKGKRLPYMLEKLQEVGISSWFPIETEFSVRDELSAAGVKKLYERVKESCKQSQNPWVLRIEQKTAFEKILQLKNVFILDVHGQAIREPVIQKDIPCTVVYGPEAGWSDAERDAVDGLNIPRVKLSLNHLRMETAAIVAAAKFQEQLQN